MFDEEITVDNVVKGLNRIYDRICLFLSDEELDTITHANELLKSQQSEIQRLKAMTRPGFGG